MSLIDHFFVSESFLDYCLDAAPLHLGDNRSNHSPIMLNIQVPYVTEKELIKEGHRRRPNWRKANDIDIDNYTLALHSKLCDLKLPSTFACQNVLCKRAQHSHERDSHVLNVMTKIIKFQ